MVLYRRDEAAVKQLLPSGAYGLQARREAPYFWQSLLVRRPKVFFLAILSSKAAGLRVPFYLAATSVCKEKVYLRLGTGYASGIYLGLLSVLSAAAVCSSSQTGAPRAGRLFLSVTNSPCCRALRACLLDICVCRQNVRAETSIAALAVVVGWAVYPAGSGWCR